MEEILYQSERTINGEKYITTITKVIENTQKELDDEVTASYDNTEEIVFNGEDAITFNVSDIPECMDIDTWLSIVKEYGIILTR